MRGGEATGGPRIPHRSLKPEVARADIPAGRHRACGRGTPNVPHHDPATPEARAGRAARAGRRAATWGARWPYLAIAALLVLVEAAIWGLGFWTGSLDRARAVVVNWAGFWPGVLGGWDPTFRLQPLTMFFTYWLVHSGPIHLLGNLSVMAWFAVRIGPDLDRSQTLQIWMASILGGAVAFGALSQSLTPMVGASGGVFGLLGAYTVIDHAERARDGGSRAAGIRTALVCAGILILSLIDFVLRDALLAWQAHLGGFVAGAVLTRALATRETS